MPPAMLDVRPGGLGGVPSPPVWDPDGTIYRSIILDGRGAQRRTEQKKLPPPALTDLTDFVFGDGYWFWRGVLGLVCPAVGFFLTPSTAN